MSTTEDTVVKVLNEILARKGQQIPSLDDKTLNGSFEQFGLDSMDKLDFAMGLEDAIGAVFVTSDMLQSQDARGHHRLRRARERLPDL